MPTGNKPKNGTGHNHTTSKGKAGTSSGTNGSSGSTQQLPGFIDTEVKLLLSELTNPESQVKFDTASRSTPGTIQNTIDPPQATWTWANAAARTAELVTSIDVGKYGLQSDVNTLFRLASASPDAVWQAVRNFETATWTWLNITARLNEKVTPADVGKVGLQSDIDTYYQLTNAAPPVWQPIEDPTGTAPGLEISTGAADATSYHDFFRLQIAFEDMWAELLDEGVKQTGEQLYALWDALMDNSAQAYDDTGVTDRQSRFSLPPPDDLGGAEELTNFISQIQALLGLTPETTSSPIGGLSAELLSMKQALMDTLNGCNMLLLELNRAGTTGFDATHSFWDGTKWLAATAGHPDANVPDDMTAFPPSWTRKEVFTKIQSELASITSPSSSGTATDPQLQFPEITGLLSKLDAMLKERYRFDVFAPASINYGLLLNYRQHWQPQSYQVGNLVSTIPLAPQELRKYTSKTVVKRTRSVKEINNSIRDKKDEKGQTMRDDAEIVDRAKNDTNFKYNASGSYGNDAMFKVQAGTEGGNDQAVESAQTKKEFHEAVLKSAQDYRDEHRVEISTEETHEDENTSYREIRNPNDELTVTYLFYELQRRYLVDESLYRVTPVVMVANDVPAPHEVDQSWILRHDWVIKRSLLDDSFLPALEYLSANYTGEEIALFTLEMAVQHQKSVVDKLSQQVLLANQAVNAATLGLQDSQQQSINDLQTQETLSFVKNIFDPLGIGQAGKIDDGNSDRARMDLAKDSLARAQAKADQLAGDMKTELTALQVAIDRYTAAARRHYEMLADIDRLRVHVKDNILHYMQAIWTYEPTDQRYFRLYNLDVPVFNSGGVAVAAPTDGLAAIDPSRASYRIPLPAPKMAPKPMKLHQIADIDTLLGFKGNYMIFPLVDFDNYMTWYLVQNYVHFDDSAGLIAADPDPGADLTLDQLKQAMAAIHAKNPATFKANEAAFQETMMRLLSDSTPQMVVVPSSSLYIDALPGTHPLLEDFKLIHRAIDVKKAQAEARKVELENLRLAARLENAEFGDPDIDKVVVVGNGHNITVDAGQ